MEFQVPSSILRWPAACGCPLLRRWGFVNISCLILAWASVCNALGLGLRLGSAQKSRLVKTKTREFGLLTAHNQGLSMALEGNGKAAVRYPNLGRKFLGLLDYRNLFPTLTPKQTVGLVPNYHSGKRGE
ncbi:unnamed protein product [Linum trigynum]|uniref:Uncharacterized protein n=1 Tax=Linum trigynum TaxID=586398 RepID=A0AAV2EH90_9ROSI